MNVRRARTQYGKASKRINSQVNEKTFAERVSEDVVLSVEEDAPKVAEKRVTKPVISRKESKSETRKHISEPIAVSDKVATSKSPTRTSESSKEPKSPQRKRKRAASPANSDSTDIVEEPAPKIAKRKLPEASPGRTSTTKPERSMPRSTTPSRPDTPQVPRLAKDLSDLFISPHKPSQTFTNGSPPKKGHLKRMLSSKSKTEPSIPATDNATSSGDFFHSHSMFNLPPSTASASPAHFAPSFNRNPLARDRTPSPTPRRGASPPPIAKSPQRPGRTYSKSRSFLIELPHDTNAMNVDNPGELSPAAQNQDIDLKDIHRESYTELRSRWGIEHSEQDSAPINDLNSVGEMRSRGETRRFLDEVGYLFDGLDATTSNSSAKRASAIEIVSKMGDPDFQRRATAADFTGRAWKVLRTAGAGSGNDKILDASLIAFVAIATKEAHQTHDLLKSKDLVTFLGTSIEIKSDEDVLISLPTSQEQAWARRHGLSRVDRTSLTALRAAIENSNILEKGTSVSHRLLASMSLLKISQLGQPFDAITTDAILMSLDHELSQLSVEDDPSDQLPFLNGLDLWHTYNCIKLLEHLASSLSSTSQTNNPIVSKLASFVSMWPVLVHEDYPIDFIGTTIEAALRYMIVVTHENPEWCEELSTTPTLIHNLLRLFLRNYHVYFSSPEATQGKDAKAVEEEEEDAGSTNLRTATLSLGLITQLIKQSSTARTHLRETTLSKDCPAKGDCSRECTCKKRTSGLQCLVALFSHVHNGLDEQAEAQAHFIRGHIGVLLGYLYVYDTESRRPIIRTLKPHGQSDSEKLRALITLVREFCALLTTVMDKAAHQQETSSQTSGRDGGSDAPPALSLGDGSLDEGVQLAQEVIQGLEGLL